MTEAATLRTTFTPFQLVRSLPVAAPCDRDPFGALSALLLDENLSLSDFENDRRHG